MSGDDITARVVVRGSDGSTRIVAGEVGELPVDVEYGPSECSCGAEVCGHERTATPRLGVDRAARSLKGRGLVWFDRPRVLVTGGRDYADAETVARVLSELAPGEIAQGGANGADRLAALWAHDTGTNCVTFPADWAKHGRSAGPIRNRRMLDEFQPDLVLAFPGGRGTAHMVSYADFCGVPVIRAVEAEIDSAEVF